MAVIALFLSDAAAGARLASALDDDHRVLHSPSWRQLSGLVARHPVDLCVIDPYDPFRPISRQRLQRLRRKHPDLAIVVYADFDGRASDLLDLGRIQVDGILQATGHERRPTIRKVVDRSLARSAAARHSINSRFRRRSAVIRKPARASALRWSASMSNTA